MVSHADFAAYQVWVQSEMTQLGQRLTLVETKENKGSGKGGKPLCEQIWGSTYQPNVLTIEIASKAEKFREWSLSVKDFMEIYIPI